MLGPLFESTESATRLFHFKFTAVGSFKVKWGHISTSSSVCERETCFDSSMQQIYDGQTKQADETGSLIVLIVTIYM